MGFNNVIDLIKDYMRIESELEDILISVFSVPVLYLLLYEMEFFLDIETSKLIFFLIIIGLLLSSTIRYFIIFKSKSIKKF